MVSKYVNVLISNLTFVFLLQSPDKLLDNDPEFFHRFTIVIGVQLPERYDIQLILILTFYWVKS